MVGMMRQLPPILLVCAMLISGVQCYSCPAYDSIATQRVASSSFSLDDMVGEWYMMGTSEPTLPPFCTCSKLHWFVDSSDGKIKQYHYDFAAHCSGMNVTVTMKGEARDPTRPGLLSENMAVYNHSIAPYCPHMVYDVKTLPDGNIVGFTYACLLGQLPVNMFSFNIVAKRPTLTINDLKGLVAEQNERTGGVLDVQGIRYSDRSVCGWEAMDIMV